MSYIEWEYPIRETVTESWGLVTDWRHCARQRESLWRTTPPLSRVLGRSLSRGGSFRLSAKSS